MKTIKTTDEMRVFGSELRSESKTIGFVPTMGALHEGHLSLVKRSKSENDITVVSIFVNPTQFGPKEDLDQYPRDMEGDLCKLSGLDTDAVFIPDDKEMYPDGAAVSIYAGHIGEILCGASRPGHFDGVATVVARLFSVVLPHRAYFGQKDYQQTVVIKKMVMQQEFDVEIVVCPVIREPDGLAMSSRNTYLNADERRAATVLYRALKKGEDLIKKGANDPFQVIKQMEKVIRPEPLAEPEYLEIVDPEELSSMEEISLPACLCLAVKIGSTRLIDNLIVGNSAD